MSALPPRGRVALAAGLLAAAVAFAPAAALAHSQPYSWLDLHLAGDTLRGEATTHVVDLAHEAGLPVPDSLRSPGFLARHAGELERVLGRRLELLADGERVVPEWIAITSVPERSAVRFTFVARAGRAAELSVAHPLFTWEDQHETYFNVWAGDSLRHQDLLDHEHRASVYRTGRPRSVWAVVRRFVREGMHHIFIGPDHILFVVGLLLLGGDLKRLARIVTAFTVAHSVTLALATLGIVTPPARIVEPLIALSIVVVGAENLLGDGRRDLRTWLAFGFGFVHGFGFASVLRELSLPREALAAALVSFNVGVELGQMAIVLAVAPLLGLLRARRPALSRPVLAWGSAVVIVAGSGWFVQRVFFGPG